MKKLIAIVAILLVMAGSFSSCYNRKPPCPAYIGMEQTDVNVDLERS